MRELPRGVYKLKGNRRYSVVKNIKGKTVSYGGFETVQQASAFSKQLCARLDANTIGLPSNWTAMTPEETLDFMLSKKPAAPRKRVERNGWTDIEKQQVVRQQQGKCALQYRGCSGELLPDRHAYDHIDSNSANNELTNCQALCLNCHGLKTASDRRRGWKPRAS